MAELIETQRFPQIQQIYAYDSNLRIISIRAQQKREGKMLWLPVQDFGAVESFGEH